MSERRSLSRLWLWPTAEQWRSWDLLQRCGYIGFILGVVGVLVGVIPLLPSKPHQTIDGAPEEKLSASAFLSPSEVLPGLTAEETQQIRAMLSDPATIGQARLLLEQMRARPHTRQGIDSIHGLLIATYYGQKQYREGLEYLCKITAELPRDDFRYRFQFHALVRAIAATDGRAVAEATITKLRRRSDRPELSRVWIGLPLRMMEALRKGRLPEDDPYVLADSDRSYLTSLVDTAPKEPFLDYAHYFLGNYRKVLSGFPLSQIRDLTFRAEAARASDCTLPATCDPATAHADLAAVAKLDPKNFPETVEVCRDHFAKSGRLDDALRAASLVCGSDCTEAIELIVESASEGTTTLPQVAAWLDATSPRLVHDSWFMSQIAAFDRSLPVIESGNYRGAESLLESEAAELTRRKLNVPAWLSDTLTTVRKLAQLATPTDAAGIFALGLAEIDAGKKRDEPLVWQRNALRTFRRIEDAFPTSDLAPRASYLRAATYRHMHEYDKAIGVVDEFLRRYPNSALADDMLAERGVHFLLVEGNWPRAQATFEEVIRRFPTANAADNALNWMAWRRLKDCDYAGAYETYRRLATAYPANRLGIRAMKQMVLIHHAVGSRRTHVGVGGLQLSRDGEPEIVRVEPQSAAQRAGFVEGSTITSVNGVAVYTARAFYALLQHMSSGRMIGVALRDSQRIVQVPVQPVDYYEEVYHLSRCGM
jgi:tetratricopeptide (TPR) repeat protein